MPPARPLPKKHAAAIQDSLADIKTMAHRTGFLLEQIASRDRTTLDSLQTTLQEIQSSLYAVALRLSEVEVARNCDTCPSAPAQTSTDIYLAMLSQKLRQLSEETWQTAQGAALIHLHDENKAS